MNCKAPGSKSASIHFFYGRWLLLLALSFLCAQTAPSSAQKASALPPSELSLAQRADFGPIATIGYAHSSVRTQSRRGRFPLAGIGGRETVNVRLQFSPQYAGAPFLATALDGGEAIVPGQSSVIASDGTASMLFKASAQPGLYRVLVSAGGNRSMLKFWVPDSKNPQSNPPVLQPGN